MIPTSLAFTAKHVTRVFLWCVALFPAALSQVHAEPAQAVDLSTRMLVQTDNYVGIGGFIIRGTTQKHVLLRALGPSLSKVGVPNVVANPSLELRDSNGLIIAQNNNWRDTQQSTIEATGMPPGNDLESAIEVTLDPDQNYTAILQSENGVSGLALLEIYDLNPSSNSKLANISTRAVTTPGDNTLIAGFILAGDRSDGVIIRGLGPSLPADLPGRLMDPVLQLRDANGALVATNNDWANNTDQAAEIAVAGLEPSDSHEAAIAAILPAGNYTALLTGENETSGLGLVEIYDLGPAAADTVAAVTRTQTGTVTNIEAQHVAIRQIADTFRLVFTLPSSINQSAIGSRAALQGITAPISINASAGEIQAAIVAIPTYYAFGQFGNPELIEGSFSYFAGIGAVNRDPIVTGTGKEFTIYFGSRVGSPTEYNTWVAGLPLVSVAVP